MAETLQLPEGAETYRETPTERQIVAYGDVTYRQFLTPRWPRELRMNIVAPNERGPHPAALYFTGGSFMRANYHNFATLRLALAKAGFVTAAVEYSTVPHAFPAQIDDAKHAVAYLRAHADDLQIDPDKILSFGDSAGATITQLLVTTSGTDDLLPAGLAAADTRIAAGVSLFGVATFLPAGHDGHDLRPNEVQEALQLAPPLILGIARGLLQGVDKPRSPEEAIATSRAASATTHVRADEPPLLLLHGAKDTFVPPEQSVAMYQAARAVGAPVELRIHPEASHGSIHWDQPGITAAMVAWAAEQVGWDTAFDPEAAANRVK